MNKYLYILYSGILILSTPAYAEKKPAPEDHSGHTMDAMDHSGHDMSHIHEHDMSHHDSGDHKIDDPDDHSMLHADGDHAGHQAHAHGHHHMDEDHIMDHEGGMIMGQNFNKLPSSCDSISEEIEITIRAGRKYAEKFPGTAFAFDNQEWRVKPCAKVTFHFMNDDSVRHQLMIHGLPRYLYKYGMFHLEVTGPKTITGTIIVPGADETYLVHCDIAQHMENGMKAQLVVGNGGEDMPSIPGLTPYAFSDTYKHIDLPLVSDKNDNDSIIKQVTDFFNSNALLSGMMIIGLLFGALIVPLLSQFKSLKKKNDAIE